MVDLSDYELRTSSADPLPPAPAGAGSFGVWVVALLVVAAGAAAYVFFGRSNPSTDAPATAISAPSTGHQAPQSLGGAAQPITVPPLDESDPVVRKLVSALSAHPRVAAWLTTNDLIRNFVVVVENIAHGTTPAARLAVLRPSSTFRVVERNGEMFVDSRSYERYSGIAEAVASIDPTGSASLYATLKPRIEDAYAELGRSEPFDATLERAIVVLLQTPVVDRDVSLALGPVGYRFADSRLERLAPPQKQLLRMGANNVRRIQESLRRIALALGVPADRLPPAAR